ncbi:putative grisea protein [Botrytis fragariae]|uniref:Putative grisea protein n=1 Tax=Botrytis fragariae TaxID=1964551 RepID=A0A8H6EFC4_9HELO|nr:putative grisea protein [Botrytis fragariae]KAF5870299.1 putative grisea protein [Botrytis fragariae]
MSKSVGYDARESLNVIATMGKHVSRTESKKGKIKAKKGGIGDAQKNRVKRRAKDRKSSSSRKTSSPSPKCPVSDQQEVLEDSSNTEPELILDPTQPRIFISSSIPIPAISNFLPPITTLNHQVQDHDLVAPQNLCADHSPSCIFHHQHQNDQAGLRTPFSSPFLRYH